MKKSSQKNGCFPTLAQFAVAIGTPLPTLAGWVRRPEWPFERKAPWPTQRAGEVLKWAAHNLERGRHGKELLDTGERARLNDEEQRLKVRKLSIQVDLLNARKLHMLGVLRSRISVLASSHGMSKESSPAFESELEKLVRDTLRRLNRSPDNG